MRRVVIAGVLVVLVVTCGVRVGVGATEATESDLRFGAVATTDPMNPRSMKITVTVSNVRWTGRRVSFGACRVGTEARAPARVRLYRTADRSDPPVWDSVMRAGPEVFCRGVGISWTLFPWITSAPDEWALDVDLSNVGPGSLPDGTYYATASLMLSRPNLSKEIPAGAVTLASRERG